MKSRFSLISLVIFGLLVCSGIAETRHSKELPPLALGGHKIAETLDDFKASFPTSACGKAETFVITRQTLTDPGDSKDITCCVDEPPSLAKISKRFKIVGIFGQCELLAFFHKEHLVQMSYAIDARSIEAVLPDFASQFGEPDDKRFRSIMGRKGRIGDARWIYDDDFLQLTMRSVTGPNYDSYSSHTKPFVTVYYVEVDLVTRKSLLK